MCGASRGRGAPVETIRRTTMAYITSVHRSLGAACATALLAANPAFATNGYLPHGYGMKAKGMGGASVALAEDAMGGANNPASMAFVGNRIDVGAEWFRPERSSQRSGAGFSTLNGRVDSGHENFLIPEFGYNRMIDPKLSLGVTVYGNGGMNTSYPRGNFNCGAGPANMLCGGGSLVVLISLPRQLRERGARPSACPLSPARRRRLRVCPAKNPRARR